MIWAAIGVEDGIIETIPRARADAPRHFEMEKRMQSFPCRKTVVRGLNRPQRTRLVSRQIAGGGSSERKN